MGASGSTTVDFGAFPGAYDAATTITGQTGISSGSLVGAWILPTATADHTADEHLVEPLRVVAGNIVAGTGFTIYVFNLNDILSPPDTVPPARELRWTSASAVAWTATPFRQEQPAGTLTMETSAPRVYGLWTVAWVWN